MLTVACLSSQCRPRSDAAELGIWSWSTLFATHPADWDAFSGINVDFWILLEIQAKQLGVWIFLVNTVFITYPPQFLMKMEILVKEGFDLNIITRLGPDVKRRKKTICTFWIKKLSCLEI